MILEYSISHTDSLFFWGEEINSRHDFFVKTNSSLAEIDLLFFFDSRGISKDYETSLIKLIIDHLEDQVKYLIVGRPLDITIWLTLYNFLQLNDIRPKKIVTNMGIVDFTPKKRSIIELTLYQYQPYFRGLNETVRYVEEFTNQEGEKMDLFVQEYPDSFLEKLKKKLSNYEVIIIDTPYVSPDIKFQRRRPSSFYKSLELTKMFNSLLDHSAQVMFLPEFRRIETYDAVHYTLKGNEFIFNCLKSKLIKH